jgi:hypothetical protein
MNVPRKYDSGDDSAQEDGARELGSHKELDKR